MHGLIKQTDLINEKLVNFRKELHQYPETAFQQHETRNRIKAILRYYGVQSSQMVELPPTALYVDLRGRGPPSGKPKCIAFRADMDALPILQANQDLEYRSKVEGKAHMCGHDGHMACLVGFVPKFMEKIDSVPSDKTIRLLFQPCEEGPGSGAKKMIEDGCLIRVDQIYGFHQWPVALPGQLYCKSGPVMSEITTIDIKIIGTSGHASQPEKSKFSLRPAIKFYQKLLDFIDQLKQKSQKLFAFSLPVFQAGQKDNVISENVNIRGTLRSYDDQIRDQIINKLEYLLEQQVAKKGFKYEFNPIYEVPAVVNSRRQAQNVLRVGEKVLGKGKAHQGPLPVRASQDFSYFTQKIPGAYFFLSSSKSSENQPMIHNCNFDFNDELIKIASQIWWELAKDRFQMYTD